MKLLVATSAHPPGDVRVRRRIVESLKQSGFSVQWVGPLTTGGFYDDVDPELESIFFPGPIGRRDRLRAPIGLRSALRTSSFRPDWIYCPDPDALPIASAYACRVGARLWFDVHENFHGASLHKWTGQRVGELTQELLRRWIKNRASKADLLTAVSVPLLSYYGTGAQRREVLHNAARTGFANEAHERRNATRVFRLMHGKVGDARGTPVLADALELLETRCVQVRAICIGQAADLARTIGERRAAELCRPERFAGFEVVPPRKHEDMGALVRSCDAGLLSYVGASAADSMPNRLFEYMALGLPIICSSDNVQAAHFVRAERIGVIYSPATATEMSLAIESLGLDLEKRAILGSRSREAFLERFNWEIEFDRIRRILMDEG